MSGEVCSAGKTLINEINFLDCSPRQEGYFLFSLLKDFVKKS